MLFYSTFFPVTSNFAAESSEGGIAALGVDFKALVLQIITFVIVFLLLKKFAFAKIVRILEERHETIEKGVKLGREMEQERSKLEERIAEALKEARANADKIIAKAHTEAGEILKTAEASAARKTEGMLSDANVRINDELKRARKALEQEMLTLVADATEAIIDEKLDTKKDNTLISKALQGAKS